MADMADTEAAARAGKREDRWGEATVRVATPEDADLLGTLAAEIFVTTFGADNDPQDMADYVRQAFSRDRMTAELRDAGSRFFLVQVEGQPIGYAKLRRSNGLGGGVPACVPDPDAVELQRIYVLAAWHGSGAAQMLMQACVDYARQIGSRTLWLGVEEDNRRAYRFYAKWGFQQVGTHTFVLGSDAQNDHVLLKQLL
jgi:ribosomal protein S18 acetylase RimI-like enzyme